MNTINRLRFIKSAISSDKSRLNLCKAYYDAKNSRLVSTDGRAMHCWDLTSAEKKELGIKGKESSYVDIVVDRKTFALTMVHLEMLFVKYERIIPEYGRKKECDYKINPTRYKTMEMAKFLVVFSIPIDIKYLDPFWPCDRSQWAVVKAPGNEYRQKSVVFRGEDEASGVWGVVMPFQLD